VCDKAFSESSHRNRHIRAAVSKKITRLLLHFQITPYAVCRETPEDRFMDT